MTELAALDNDLVARARALGSATLHEAADRTGALPPTMRPVSPAMRFAGRARTILAPAGDNLWLHRAIYVADPGDVLVVATGDVEAQFGYWGEIMSEAASARDLAGLVLQGGSRDHEALATIGFPVFSLGSCIRGTIKDKNLDYGRIDVPVRLGDVTVHSGALVVGDVDGVVAIAASAAAATVDLGDTRVAKEQAIIDKLRRGASTLDLYGLHE